MKKILFALAALLLPLAGMAKEKVEQPVKVRWCTFNIRCIAAPDEKIGCSWEVRKDNVAQYVLDNNIDIVGMQEVTFKQLNDLRERLKGYDYVGVGRTDGKERVNSPLSSSAQTSMSLWRRATSGSVRLPMCLVQRAGMPLSSVWQAM